MSCRACGNKLMEPVVNLGMQPLPNQLRDHRLDSQVFYPLDVVYCPSCELIQTSCDIDPGEIFNADYPYFSSANASEYWEKYASWVTHYHLTHMGNGDLRGKSVLEIASNDGYLLKHFADDVDVVGYEPCQSVALKAIEQGIETVCDFFDESHPYDGAFDVVIGNNVLAHTPDPVGMLKAAREAVKPSGAILFEFPHAYQMFQKLEWDTIYHEHYSYLSVAAIRNMAKMAGLEFIYSMETPIHGGSLRVLLRRSGHQTGAAFEEYDIKAFRDGVKAHKRKIQRTVCDLKDKGYKIAGFGAAAKGATLINYCGIADSIDYIVDETEWKQGRYVAGTNIAITGWERLALDPPDYLWIFPWNFADQIVSRLKPVYDGHFITTKNGEVQCNH